MHKCQERCDIYFTADKRWTIVMKNNLNDEDLTYALDLSGRMVKIDSIPSDKRGLE